MVSRDHEKKLKAAVYRYFGEGALRIFNTPPQGGENLRIFRSSNFQRYQIFSKAPTPHIIIGNKSQIFPNILYFLLFFREREIPKSQTSEGTSPKFKNFQVLKKSQELLVNRSDKSFSGECSMVFVFAKDLGSQLHKIKFF